MTAMRALSRRDAAARIATANTMAISATTLRPCPIMLSLPSLVQIGGPCRPSQCGTVPHARRKSLHRLPQQNFNAVDHDGGQRGARLANAGITGAAADEPAT